MPLRSLIASSLARSNTRLLMIDRQTLEWAAKYRELLQGYVEAMGGTSITAPRRALAEQIAVLQTELSVLTDRFASGGRGGSTEDLAIYLKLSATTSDLMQTAGLGPSLQQPIVDQDRVAGAREELAALLTRRSAAQERERERGIYRDNNHKIIDDPARLQLAQEIYRLQQLAEQIDSGETTAPSDASPEPLVITKVPPSPPPELTVVATAPSPPPAPTPLTDAALEEQRHRLAGRRASLQRERGRLAEALLTNPTLRPQLDKLITEQAAVDTELQQINNTLNARLAAQPSTTTQSFLEWNATGSGMRFHHWSPGLHWPRLR
jgi:hypothetical protein